MFGTFTGNSKRARNVNLSGQTGNPFSNTSWTPGSASSANKVVHDAQAQRERRQADRHRVASAKNIQRVWRGHRARCSAHEDRRANFDRLYSSGIDSRKRAFALQAISFFYDPRRADDVQRLKTFVGDLQGVGISDLPSDIADTPTIARLQRKLVSSLKPSIARETSSTDICAVLDLILHIARNKPHFSVIKPLIVQYFDALSDLYAKFADDPAGGQMITYIGAPFDFESKYHEDNLYHSLAFDLFARDLPLVREHIHEVKAAIDVCKLAIAIMRTYNSQIRSSTKEQQLWLLAHLVDLGQPHQGPADDYLIAIYGQLSMLSADIRPRFAATPGDVLEKASPLPPYIMLQLGSLVKVERLSQLAQEFSIALTDSNAKLDVSLIAGLILALMLCFPAQADDIRMRLFLTSALDGTTPVVRLLWMTLQDTGLVKSLTNNPADLVEVFGLYLRGRSPIHRDERDWRLLLLFLELYIFVLRISDDEDFLKGLKEEGHSHTKDGPMTMLRRLRATNLSQSDLELLSIALRNAGAALYYYQQSILEVVALGKTAAIRQPLSNRRGKAPSPDDFRSQSTEYSIKPDFEHLKATMSTSLHMLYERDARLHFLPTDHWLMTRLFDANEFLHAAMEEEEAWSHQSGGAEEDDSDETDEEMIEARDPKSKPVPPKESLSRRMANMAPKLEILRHMPFVIPFESRVLLFKSFINLERRHMSDNFAFMHGKHTAQIRRGKVFQDAYDQLYKIGEGLKDRLNITFYDQFDTMEAGIDGGGVTKEFLTSVITEALSNKELSLFAESPTGLVYPDPTAIDCLRTRMHKEGVAENSPEWNSQITELLKMFEFLGRIFGKCMHEGILVDVTFASFFLLKWPAAHRKETNNYKGSVNDLRDLDESLYRGLLQLKNYEGDLSQLGIDFTIVDSASRPGEPSATITRELMKNGETVVVNNDNRLLYNSYVARHRLIRQPYQQTQAFLRGLRQMIQPHWLAMFNQSELQRLVGGDSVAIDVDDLRRNTEYSGLYVIGDDNEEHPTIKLFWKVFGGFTDKQKADTLKYITSTPRAPLLGFSQLQPKFAIRDSGADETRLPSTSTCVNLLKLPRYTTEATLREKLLYAIESGAGFDLS